MWLYTGTSPSPLSPAPRRWSFLSFSTALGFTMPRADSSDRENVVRKKQILSRDKSQLPPVISTGQAPMLAAVVLGMRRSARDAGPTAQNVLNS